MLSLIILAIGLVRRTRRKARRSWPPGSTPGWKRPGAQRAAAPRGGRRRGLPPPRLPRTDRHHPERRRGPRLPRLDQRRQARTADPQPPRRQAVRRALRAGSGRARSRRPGTPAGRSKPGCRPSSARTRRSTRWPRSVLTATGDANTASPAAFYFAVGNTPGAGRRGGGARAAGCAARLCAVPQPPARELDAGGLLGPGGVLRRHRHDAGSGDRRDRDQDHPDRQHARSTTAKFLDGPAPKFAGGTSPRAVLADWLATPENPLLRRQRRQPRLAGPVRHRAGLDDRRPRHARRPRSGSRSSTSSPPSSPPAGSTSAGWSRASA